MNLVPVVRGAMDHQYNREAKHHSYINAYNYDSPKSLANYLNYLDRNDTAYLEYFNWKIDMYKQIQLNIESKKTFSKAWNVSTEYHLRQPFCTLCSYLHNETYLNNKNNDNRQWKISEWFSAKKNCWDKKESRVFIFKILKFLGFCF